MLFERGSHPAITPPYLKVRERLCRDDERGKGKSDLSDDRSAKSVVVHARFTAEQTAKLDAAWRAEGFLSRSAYLRHLALTGIGEASASPASVDAMRGVRSELAATGRNLNQAVREMHRRRKAGLVSDPAALVKVEDLEALNREIGNVAAILKSYLSQAPKKRKAKA